MHTPGLECDEGKAGNSVNAQNVALSVDSILLTILRFADGRDADLQYLATKEEKDLLDVARTCATPKVMGEKSRVRTRACMCVRVHIWYCVELGFCDKTQTVTMLPICQNRHHGIE